MPPRSWTRKPTPRDIPVNDNVNQTAIDAAEPQAAPNICTAASGDVCRGGATGSLGGEFNVAQGKEEPITIRMTGCPNGCARPYIAETALTGRAPGKYNLYLGGGFYGQRFGDFAIRAGIVPEVKEGRVFND